MLTAKYAVTISIADSLLQSIHRARCSSFFVLRLPSLITLVHQSELRGVIGANILPKLQAFSSGGKPARDYTLELVVSNRNGCMYNFQFMPLLLEETVVSSIVGLFGSWAYLI